MAGAKRRVLGILVISAGVCAALPFRNDTVNSPIDTGAATEFPRPAASQNELMLQLTIPTIPVAAPMPDSREQPDSDLTATKPAPQPQEVRREDLQTPPSIASAFEPLVTTLAVVAEEAAPVKSDEPQRRRHRIADGDTLEAIADRYLGDRNQWPSIFAANEGLLTDRDILPIGKEIKIPQIANPSRDDSDDHLVPIPPGLLNGSR